MNVAVMINFCERLINYISGPHFSRGDIGKQRGVAEWDSDLEKRHCRRQGVLHLQSTAANCQCTTDRRNDIRRSQK